MQNESMTCRVGCGACCIAITISSPLPGLPFGTKAGERCLHLDDENQCRIWGQDDYPPVCRDFPPMLSHCGDNREEALRLLNHLEVQTAP